MEDRKIDILAQLEKGEITASEAFTLLSQVSHASEVNETSAPAPEVRPETTPPPGPSHAPNHGQDQQQGRQYQQDYQQDHQQYQSQNAWVDDVTNSIGETIHDITEGLGGALEDVLSNIKEMHIGSTISDIFTGQYAHHKASLQFTTQPISQGIGELTLLGINAPVRVQGYSGDRIQVHCSYDARRPHAEVHFTEENGIFRLMYDKSLMRHMEITCQVPKSLIQHGHFASKNAEVVVEDILTHRLDLFTSNAKITATHITTSHFTGQTKNAAIKAYGIKGEHIQLVTTNGKIQAENIHTHILDLKTTNGAIKPVGIDADHIRLFTTNGGLKLENLFVGIDMTKSWPTERTLYAHTSNSGVKLYIPLDVALKFSAHTSSGKIICRREDMYIEAHSKNHSQGTSRYYRPAEEAPTRAVDERSNDQGPHHMATPLGNQMAVQVETSNATVKIL